jgi:hypothetical protein
MTKDHKDAYSSPIAAEAVGETLGSPPPLSEHAVRPDEKAAGPQARVADKTAESVGERTGVAYADATTDEALERSRKAVRAGAARASPCTPRSTNKHSSQCLPRSPSVTPPPY